MLIFPKFVNFFFYRTENKMVEICWDTELCNKKKDTFETFINVTTRISYSVVKIIHLKKLKQKATKISSIYFL